MYNIPFDPKDTSVNDLVQMASTEIAIAGNSGSSDVNIGRASVRLKIANIKLQEKSIQLTTISQKLAEEHLQVASRTNELTEKLLLSNEEASKQGERNAELMYKATEQLAESTRSLNWATWVLVIFTAVQAFIAIAAFLKK